MSIDLTAGSRVSPRGAVATTVVPWVKATVLLPTDTVVSSGNPV